MLLRIISLVTSCYAMTQAGTLWFSPVTATVGTGATLTLDLNVNDVSDLFAFGADVKFDPTVLQALSVSEGAFLSSGGFSYFFPGEIDNVGGFITFIGDSLGGTSGVTGSGILASLSFQALAEGSTAIELQNVVLLDSTLAGIPIDVLGGNVGVVVPEPDYTGVCFAVGLVGVLLGGFRDRTSRRC